VVSYVPPCPPYGSGLHRLFFVLFQQPFRLRSDDPRFLTFQQQRHTFNLAQCIQQLGLVQPVGIDGCYVEWDESCDDTHLTIGYTPPSEYHSPRTKGDKQVVEDMEEPPVLFNRRTLLNILERGSWSPTPRVKHGPNHNNSSFKTLQNHHKPSSNPLLQTALLNNLQSSESASPDVPLCTALTPSDEDADKLDVTVSEDSHPQEHSCAFSLDESVTRIDQADMISDDVLLIGDANSNGLLYDYSSGASSALYTGSNSISRYNVPSPGASFTSFIHVASPTETLRSSRDRDLITATADGTGAPDMSRSTSKLVLVSALKGSGHGKSQDMSSLRRKSVSFKVDQVVQLIDTSMPEEIAYNMLDYDFDQPDYQLDYSIPSTSASAMRSSSSSSSPDSSNAPSATNSMSSMSSQQGQGSGHEHEHWQEGCGKKRMVRLLKVSNGKKDRPPVAKPSSGHHAAKASVLAVVEELPSELPPSPKSSESVSIRTGPAQAVPSCSSAIEAAHSSNKQDQALATGISSQAQHAQEPGWRRIIQLAMLHGRGQSPLRQGLALCSLLGLQSMHHLSMLQGNVVKKKYGTDFTFKESFMWVDLQTLSLYW
jgi:hypothetical protein